MAKRPVIGEEEDLAEGEGEETPTPEGEGEQAEPEVITDPGAAAVEAEAEAKPEGEGEAEAKPTAEGKKPEPEAEGVEAEGEEAAEAPAFAPRLMQAARRSGLSDEEVTALGQRAETVLGKLADGYDAVSRDLSTKGKPTFTQEQLDQIRIKGPEGVQAPKDDLATDLLVELDPDIYGDEMVGAVKDRLLPRINALSKEVKQLRQAEYNRRAEALYAQADQYFESVKQDYGELFGEGQTLKLERGTPAHEARLAVFREADIIANGAAAVGRSMSVAEALDRAVSIVTRDKALETARQEVARTVQKRAGQAIQKPSHRAPTKSYRKPEEKAADAVAEKMRQMGYSPAEED